MGKERGSAEEMIKTIRRKTRRQYPAEEKIRIVMEGLQGGETVAELCRREGIAQSHQEPGSVPVARSSPQAAVVSAS